MFSVHAAAEFGVRLQASHQHRRAISQTPGNAWQPGSLPLTDVLRTQCRPPRWNRCQFDGPI